MDRPLIFDFSKKEVQDYLHQKQQPAYRSEQLWQSLYKELIDDPLVLTTLSKELRNHLSDDFSFRGLEPVKTIYSQDKLTQKILFQLQDGHFIETVLMIYHQRNTVCLSTQVGCPVGCSFCATGQMGFFRNLSAGEIVEQVLHFERDLRRQGEHVTNVVYMGMGEPFLNYEKVMKSIDILNDHQGFNLGERRITISTVGLPDKIRQFADEKRQMNLAVSLHTPFDRERDALIPINQRFNIAAIMASVRYYIALTNRRVTFEYALIAGVNDDEETARALTDLIKGLLCHVNLIPVNDTDSKNSFTASSSHNVEKFADYLRTHGIPVSVRLRRGTEIKAGCGQLAAKQPRNQ
jgi:23S rRNA (adenine2503-C2)-methyltransferase